MYTYLTRGSDWFGLLESGDGLFPTLEVPTGVGDLWLKTTGLALTSHTTVMKTKCYLRGLPEQYINFVKSEFYKLI